MGTNQSIGGYSLGISNSGGGMTSVNDDYDEAGTILANIDVPDDSAWAEVEITAVATGNKSKQIITASYDNIKGGYVVPIQQFVNEAFELSITLYNAAVATIVFEDFLVYNTNRANILINEMFDRGFDEMWDDNNLNATFLPKAVTWSIIHDGSTTETKSLLTRLPKTINIKTQDVYINHKTYGVAPIVFVATSGELVWITSLEETFLVKDNIQQEPSGFTGKVNAVGFYWYMQPY